MEEEGCTLYKALIGLILGLVHGQIVKLGQVAWNHVRIYDIKTQVTEVIYTSISSSWENRATMNEHPKLSTLPASPIPFVKERSRQCSV